MIPIDWEWALNMKVLSVRQPWAWAICDGFALLDGTLIKKDIENRTWWTSYRGFVLIHSGKQWHSTGRDELASELWQRYCETIEIPRDMRRGGIVGMARIVNCVSYHESKWFEGPYGFVLEDQKPLPFLPCRGRQGLFSFTDEIF